MDPKPTRLGLVVPTAEPSPPAPAREAPENPISDQVSFYKFKVFSDGTRVAGLLQSSIWGCPRYRHQAPHQSEAVRTLSVQRLSTLARGPVESL